MKLLLCLLATVSVACSAADLTGVGDIVFGIAEYNTHYITAPDAESIVMQTNTGGINLLSGASVVIQSGTSSGVIIAAPADNSVQLTSGGDITLQAASYPYQVLAYGDSMSVQTDYGLQIKPMQSLPTCDASRRGTLYYAEGATSVADQLKVCRKDATDSYAWEAVSF